MNSNLIKTTLLIVGLSTSAFGSVAVSAEAVKTARSNTSTVQTESNSATVRELSPINATDINARFPNNLLLAQSRGDSVADCIRKFDICATFTPRADCGSCINFCVTQRDWPDFRCPLPFG